MWRPADPWSGRDWVPKNDTERAMHGAVVRDDRDEFLRVFAAAAELYLPQVPTEGVAIRKRARAWVPLTRQVAGRVSVPVFTSAAGMRSVVFGRSYVVTRYDEFEDHGVASDRWLAINPGTPIAAYLPAGTVGQVARGELNVVEDRLFPVDDEAGDYEYLVDEPPFDPLIDAVEEPVFPGRVLHDPTYMAAHDEMDDVLLGSIVVVPTTREVVDVPGELFRPGFPWRLAGPGSPAATDPYIADRPTIEAFTTDDRFVAVYRDSPGVRVWFPVLMAAWPEGHALFVNPGSVVTMGYPAHHVPALQQQADYRLPWMFPWG